MQFAMALSVISDLDGRDAGRRTSRMRVLLLVILFACGDRESHQVPQGVPSTEPSVAVPAPPTRCDSPNSHFCVGDTVVECLADRTVGLTVQTCKGRCANGSCADTCALKDVELIYVVDAGDHLSSFDPRKLPGDPFHQVGTLACDPSSHPFSMAVDREGIAWVLYANGKLFRVSIIDAHCSAALPRIEGASPTYGMGFVSDGVKAATETLYVAPDSDSHQLATLDTKRTPPRWEAIGSITASQQRNPELTGTSDGKLYAFFPETGRGFVQEIDRSTAAPLGKRMNLEGPEGRVNSWAFAHWGGVFYVFVTVEQNSTVQAIHRKTGKYEMVLQHLPGRIVGAGVSTCAPLLEHQ